MLVLARKKNESIVINNDVTIVVVDIRGDKVRLGADAPASVPVHRYEVWEAIQDQRRRAAESLAARLNAAHVLERSDWTAAEILTTTDPMLRSALVSEFQAIDGGRAA